MRVLRVRYQDKTFYASLIGDQVHCLNRSLGLSAPLPLRELMVLPPVAPTKIVCCAMNYHSRVEENGKPAPTEPVLFLKPPSAVIGSGQPIIIPPQCGQIDHEGGLAIIMGKVCRGCQPGDAAEHVFGYCCANDVTARELKLRDGQFGRAKGFDTFAPIGPWIETHVDNPSDLTIKTYVNGEVRQQGNTSDMLFPPFELVSFISKIMTLNPGDVIVTGTPSGASPIAPGDEVRVEIGDVGLLINGVVAGSEERHDVPLQ